MISWFFDITLLWYFTFELYAWQAPWRYLLPRSLGSLGALPDLPVSWCSLRSVTSHPGLLFRSTVIAIDLRAS